MNIAKKTSLQSTSQSTSNGAKTPTQADSKKPKFNQERYEQVMKALGRSNLLALPKDLIEEGYEYRWVSTENPIRLQNLQSIGYEIVTRQDGSQVREFAGVNDERKSSGRYDFVLMKITSAAKEEIERFKLIHRGQQQAEKLNAAEIEEKYYTEEKQGSRKGDDLHDSFNRKFNPNNYKFF